MFMSNNLEALLFLDLLIFKVNKGAVLLSPFSARISDKLSFDLTTIWLQLAVAFAKLVAVTVPVNMSLKGWKDTLDVSRRYISTQCLDFSMAGCPSLPASSGFENLRLMS